MARDYVTIREQQRDGQTVWTFNTVKHDRLKSAPAKVTRRRDRYAIMGAAWGAPIAEVEVQIDDGPVAGRRARRTPSRAQARRLRVEVLDASTGAGPARASTRSGRGPSTSRATSSPRRTIPFLASKVTYWESNGQITRRVRIPQPEPATHPSRDDQAQRALAL